MTKVTTYHQVDPHAKLDELRKTIDTDYLDIMLLHWQHTATWPSDTPAGKIAILAAEEKKTIVRPRRVRARASGAAAGSREQVAGCCHDPHEPQGHAHGRRDRRRPRLET